LKEENTKRCILCGDKISKEVYYKNDGECENCIVEDTIVSSPEELGF